MKKDKLLESKQRLITKMKDEKRTLEDKRRTYIASLPKDDITALYKRSGTERYEIYTPVKPASPYDSSIALLSDRIKNVSNSDSYRCTKKIAKGRKRKAGK